MSQSVSAMRCENCHAVYRLREKSFGQKQVPAGVIEKLQLIECPLCFENVAKEKVEGGSP